MPEAFWEDRDYWELSLEERQRYFQMTVGRDPGFRDLTPEEQQRFYQMAVIGGERIEDKPEPNWRQVATFLGVPGQREPVARMLERAPAEVQEAAKGIASAMPGFVSAPIRAGAEAANILFPWEESREASEAWHDTAGAIEGMAATLPGPEVEGLEDVSSTRDFLKWLSYQVGGSLPHMGAIAAGTAVNPVLGATVGGILGAGGQVQATEEATGRTGGAKSLTIGTVIGLIDSLPIGNAMSRAIPKPAKAQFARWLLPRLRNAGVQSLEEAGTEFFQTLIEKLGLKWVDETQDVLTKQNFMEALEATVAGGALGAGFGGVAGVGPTPSVAPDAAPETAPEATPVAAEEKPALPGVPTQWRRATKRYANAPLWMSLSQRPNGGWARDERKQSVATRWAAESITDEQAIELIAEIDDTLDREQAKKDLRKFTHAPFYQEKATPVERAEVEDWRALGEPELSQDWQPPIEGMEEYVEVGRLIEDVPEAPGSRWHEAMRRLFRSRGKAPVSAFMLHNLQQSRVAGHMKQAAYGVREINQGIRTALGLKKFQATPKWDKLPTQLQSELNAALQGKKPVESLPEPLQAGVRKVRLHTDAMSRDFMRSGAAKGNLKAVVGKNLGVYLARAYRIFDDPKWADRVRKKHPELINRTVAWLMGEYKGLSRERAGVIVDGLLNRPDRDSNPLAVMEKWAQEDTVEGRKALEQIRKRQAIPTEIRELWGEYKDPRIRYIRSISKLAQITEAQKFQLGLREAGLRAGWLTEEATPAPNEWGSPSEKLVGEESETHDVLQGLKTTPEVKRALADMGEFGVPDSTFLRLLLQANSIVKLAKAPLSITTQVRNVLAGPLLMLAGGHWNFRHLRASLGSLATDWTGRPASQKLLAKMRAAKILEENESFEDLLLELTRRGVLDESALAGETKDLIRDAMAGKQSLGETAGNMLARASQKGLQGVMKAYMSGDNIWKGMAFLDEFSKYRAVYEVDEMSNADIRRLAAEHVRNTYPTYSLVPRAVKAIRRVPVIGTFTSFPAEIARTGYNILKLTGRELADPRLRHIGRQRAAGIMAASFTPTVLSAASRALYGVLAEDEDDLRLFMPPWSESSELMHLPSNREKGEHRYIDLSHTDPYEYLKKPLVALLNGEDWYGMLTESVLEAFDPFLSEEILVRAIREAMSNRKASGAPVYNPAANDFDKLMGIVSHVGDALTPGAIQQLQRVAKAWSDDPYTDYGVKREKGTELASTFLGQRARTLSIPEQLNFSIRHLAKDMSNAEYIFTSVAGRRKKVTAEELEKAYDKADRVRRRVFEEMHERAAAAIRLGVSRERVLEVLHNNPSITASEAQAIIDGVYIKYKPSNRYLRGLESLVSTFGEDIGGLTPEEVQRRREIAQWLSRR